MLEAFAFYNNIKPQILILEAVNKGETKCGTAFHIGDGILVTARHNIEVDTFRVLTQTEESVKVINQFVSSDESDIAVLDTDFKPQSFRVDTKIEGKPNAPDVKPNFVPISSYLAPSDLAPLYLLGEVFLFGFPPIPTTKGPKLVAVKAQINAFVETRQSKHPVFILSSTARGGFSGGPVIDENKNLIGVCIEALFHDSKPLETGFAAAICLDPLLDILNSENLFPSGNDSEIRDWPRRKDFAMQIQNKSKP